MNVVPVATACHTSLGYKTLCGRAFPCRTSGEKKSTRRCRETVLLNWEPTGGLEPPAFSLPSKCCTRSVSAKFRHSIYLAARAPVGALPTKVARPTLAAWGFLSSLTAPAARMQTLDMGRQQVRSLPVSSHALLAVDAPRACWSPLALKVRWIVRHVRSCTSAVPEVMCLDIYQPAPPIWHRNSFQIHYRQGSPRWIWKQVNHERIIQSPWLAPALSCVVLVHVPVTEGWGVDTLRP